MNISNNSITNISTLSPLDKAFFNYDIQLPYNVLLYIVLVIFMIFSNGGTMLALYKTKEVFKSNSYKLIFHMSLIITVQAVYVFINNGILRIISTVRRIQDFETGLVCGLRQFLYEITMTVDQCNILIIALDRLLSATIPLYHKRFNLSKTYLALGILIPWLWGFGEGIAKLCLYTKEKATEIELFCVMSTTRTPEFAKYVGIRGLLLALLTLGIYIVTLIVCKVKLINCSQNNIAVQKSQLGICLMKICLVDALVYTGTFFLGKVYYSIVLAYVSGNNLIVLAPLSVTFQLLATVPRFFINVYLNKAMKFWFKKLTLVAKINILHKISCLPQKVFIRVLNVHQ